MKKTAIILLVSLCVVMGSYLYGNSINEDKDYVPNAETAIKVAEAIWLPIYGEEIYESKPFKASLKNSRIWIVQGTLKEGFLGGVPYIEIQRGDCKILKVYHGK